MQKHHCFCLEMKAALSLHLVTDPRKLSLFCLAPGALVEPFWSRTLELAYLQSFLCSCLHLCHWHSLIFDLVSSLYFCDPV
jgi:hypothetical protein